jgi:hypothetical protein
MISAACPTADPCDERPHRPDAVFSVLPSGLEISGSFSGNDAEKTRQQRPDGSSPPIDWRQNNDVLASNACRTHYDTEKRSPHRLIMRTVQFYTNFGTIIALIRLTKTNGFSSKAAVQKRRR